MRASRRGCWKQLLGLTMMAGNLRLEEGICACGELCMRGLKWKKLLILLEGVDEVR